MPIINGGGAGGGVATVAATDASIVVAGTATAPTVATGTLDVIASTHAPVAAVAMNAKKITGLAVATAVTDAASLANTLDQFGAPAANVAFNAKKLTGLANGTAATDAAAFGQVGQSAAQVASAVGGVAWTVVTKTLDESVVNNTFQADDELLFTAASGGQYEVQLALVYGSPAGGGTPDFKATVGEDATIRGAFYGVGINAADTAPSFSGFLANQTGGVTFGTATTDRIVSLAGVYTGAGGTFNLLWAQVNTGVNATIVRAGSVLRYRRIV